MSDRSQAWVNAALLLLLFLTMQGTITAGIATFDARILNDLKISRGALKLRDVVQMMSASLFGILIGYATAHIRPLYIACLGLLMLALGLFLYSTVTQMWMIYLIHALPLGFAYSSAHIVVAVPILKHWFVRRQAIAIGTTLAGGSLGSSIMPQIVVQLGRFYDWRDAVAWLALIPLALLPFIAVFLKETREGGTGHDAEVMPPQRVASRPQPVEPSTDIHVSRVRRRNFVLLGIATFGLFFAGTALSAHIFLNLRDYGFSEQASASGLSLVFAAGFASKLLSGFFAERFQARPVWIVHQILMLAGAFVLVFGLKFVWIGILCFGFGWGGCFSLTQIMLADQSFGSVSGRFLGWFIAFEGFGAGSGGWLTGVMFDRLHSYVVPFVLCVLLIVVAIFATVLLKPSRIRSDKPVGEGAQQSQ